MSCDVASSAVRIFWEDSDRDDFLKRLETILTETQIPCYVRVDMAHPLSRLING